MTITAPRAPGAPRPAAMDHAAAMGLADTEYRCFVDLLRTLAPEDWERPTDCPGWDVRAIAAHTLGMMEMAASIREQRRQNRAASKRRAERGGPMIDALTGLQVDERAGMDPEEILSGIAACAPRAVRGRRRTPGFVRRRRLPAVQQVGDRQEWWSIGYLTDVILTRDPWMHRADIVRATGATHVLTPEHDGAIVADAVLEWAGRHGKPYALRLSGPAGGVWHLDQIGARDGTPHRAPASTPNGTPADSVAGPVIEMDAIEFCRALSGRGPAEGLLVTAVPF